MKKFLFVFMSLFVLNIFCFNVYAEENPEEAVNVEYEVINVDQLFNSRSTVSVMQIEGSNLDFSGPWEKNYFLNYSTDDVIVGKITYGYDGSQIYCRSDSYWYSHCAKIQVDKKVYTSSRVDAWKLSTRTLPYATAAAGSWFEFGIELYDVENGYSFYFSVASARGN